MAEVDYDVSLLKVGGYVDVKGVFSAVLCICRTNTDQQARCKRYRKPSFFNYSHVVFPPVWPRCDLSVRFHSDFSTSICSLCPDRIGATNQSKQNRRNQTIGRWYRQHLRIICRSAERRPMQPFSGLRPTTDAARRSISLCDRSRTRERTRRRNIVSDLNSARQVGTRTYLSMVIPAGFANACQCLGCGRRRPAHLCEQRLTFLRVEFGSEPTW